MAASLPNFESMKVPELNKYLHARGITTTSYKVADLRCLSGLAHEMNLDIVESSIDHAKDLKSRRTVKVIDGVFELPDPYLLSKHWSSDLTYVPDTDMPDVLTYLVSKCGWSNERLRNFRNDKGFRLFLSRGRVLVAIFLVGTFSQ
jgi:hypothetical protein